MIKDLSTLKKFFKGIKTPIFGAGVNAFNRLGPEEFFNNYKILSLYNSKETELIKKDISVFCLEEKIGKRLRPMNSTTLLCHRKTQKHLLSFKNLAILFYKPSKKIEKMAQKKNWKIIASSYRFGKHLFEDKIKFREILLKLGVEATPGRIISFSCLQLSSFLNFKKEFGLPFVLQHPRRGGGKGTFFVKNKMAFKAAKKSIKEDPAKKIIVAKFIKGSSPSITGCVTRFGILSTNLQYQV